MSQIESCKTAIDDQNFEMFMLPPKKSHRLLISFSKMIGPSIGPLADSLIGLSKGKALLDVLDQDVDLGSFFEKSFKTFFHDLDGDKIQLFMDDFAEVTHVNNMPLKSVFDVVFMGKLDLMYKWFFWGLKVQWGKSLSALFDVAKVQGAQILNQSSQSLSQTG